MTSLRKLLFVIATLALAAFALPALADGGDKFSAVMSPTSPPAQAGPIAFTATIKNLARFDYLKSYTVTVPAGLTISGTPTASSGSVSVSGQVVSVSGVLVAYTKTTKVTINATPISTLSCGSNALLWGATAKGGLLVSNEVFALDSSSVLQTTVTSLCYTLSYAAGPGGSIVGATPQTVSPGGSGSAVTPQANALFTFASWSDGSTANPRTDSNVMANVSVTASFVPNVLSITSAPTSVALATPFDVTVGINPGPATVTANTTACGNAGVSTKSSSQTSITFTLTIPSTATTLTTCSLTFAADNYTPPPVLNLAVFQAQAQADKCTPPSSDTGLPGSSFDVSTVCSSGVGVNVSGFAAGFRSVNKDLACPALNFTLTNNICGPGPTQDANSKTIPPNAVSLVWDSAQRAAFTYTVTWKAEYVDPTTGLPFPQKTQYCAGTGPNDPTPCDTLKKPMKACTSPDVAIGSIPAGEPACIKEQDWVTVSQSECSGLPLPDGTPPGTTPACIRTTTIIIDAVDPPIIRG